MSDNELLVIDTKALIPHVVFSEGGAIEVINQVKKFISTTVCDMSTQNGRDDIRSIAYKIKRTKTTLDKIGESVKDEAQKIVNQVNKERKFLWEQLEALEKDFREPLTKFENAEKNRVEEIESKIKYAFTVHSDIQNHSAFLIKELIEKIENIDATDDIFQELKPKAIAAKHAALLQLNEILEKVIIREKEQEELRILREEKESRERKESEERIAQEAQKKQEAYALAEIELLKIKQHQDNHKELSQNPWCSDPDSMLLKVVENNVIQKAYDADKPLITRAESLSKARFKTVEQLTKIIKATYQIIMLDKIIDEEDLGDVDYFFENYAKAIEASIELNEVEHLTMNY